MSTSPYTWTRMLDDFRALGGKADNIEQRVGKFGNGIFPIDPQQPVEIAIPATLLVDADQLVLDGEDLVVSPDADVPGEVREFIARYQKHFSWGADGRKHVEQFERGLKALPEALLDRLRQLRMLNLAQRHKGTWEEVLRSRFLNSRRINYHGRKVSMPVIELVNHSAKAPAFRINDGIQVRGTFADEVLVNYSPASDALQRFLNYGFASQEPAAYCLPMPLKLNEGFRLFVGCDAGTVNIVDKLPLPKVETDEKGRRLSHLRLGSERAPRLPRTLFRKALPDLPVALADEVFDRLRSANQFELCRLLELAEGVDTPVAREFRQALINQLKALSHCYGVRLD